ncbi:MAG: acyl-phosphate glycerol 3-phosphate acyltransferase [Syntrophus sp. (in: bacteria)]|nr:acyl-phosphate glycerol 3-phosphate acyltransferase [Syntrophus sp. (in: bacteria)]
MNQYLLIFCAYLIGSIPIGVILAKIKGKDPRKVGSGNIGATNVMRAAGKTLGIITLLGDILKGVIPTLLAVHAGLPVILIGVVGFATFIGHLYPVFLKFKGGKGVATALGVYLVLSPLAILASILLFILVLLKWRFVSAGSIAGTALVPLTLYMLKAPGEYVCLSLVVGILILVKHKDNIKRLMAGTESRMGAAKGK